MSTTVRVGDISITSIVEDQQPLFDPLDFFPGLTQERLEENRGWMEAAGALVNGKLVLAMQSWLIRTPSHNILVDTCVGNHKPRPARPMWNLLDSPRYMAGFKAAGVTPDEIDYVMCTHLHVDHVGWNTKLENGRWVPTFAKAKYVFSQKEHDYWASEHAKEAIPHFNDSVLPIVEAKRAQMVTSDFVLSDQISLMPTPGHTPDHFAMRVGKPGADAIVTGDFIHSPIQARYPEQGMRVDYDVAQGGRTRRTVFEACCDTATRFCFAHLPMPSTGRIKRWGEGFKIEAL